MTNTGRKSGPPTQAQEKSQETSQGKSREKSRDKSKKPPSRAEDDDYEDGDIATPKRDRYGNDDEPL